MPQTAPEGDSTFQYETYPAQPKQPQWSPDQYYSPYSYPHSHYNYYYTQQPSYYDNSYYQHQYPNQAYQQATNNYNYNEYYHTKQEDTRTQAKEEVEVGEEGVQIEEKQEEVIHEVSPSLPEDFFSKSFQEAVRSYQEFEPKYGLLLSFGKFVGDFTYVCPLHLHWWLTFTSKEIRATKSSSKSPLLTETGSKVLWNGHPSILPPRSKERSKRRTM